MYLAAIAPYQTRLHELHAQPGSSVTLFDQTKWQFAQVLGGATILGADLRLDAYGIRIDRKDVGASPRPSGGEVVQGSPREVLESSKNSEN
jgi:hypothetical protein